MLQLVMAQILMYQGNVAVIPRGETSTKIYFTGLEDKEHEGFESINIKLLDISNARHSTTNFSYDFNETALSTDAFNYLKNNLPNSPLFYYDTHPSNFSYSLEIGDKTSTEIFENKTKIPKNIAKRL